MTVTATVAAGLTEVADGVHAYTQLPGGWCVSNAGVIAGDDGLLLVDTLATQQRARHLRRAAEGLRAGPVRTVVNTHHHGDHVFGNAVFDGAEIIGHEALGPEMAETGLALTLLWPDVDWGDVELRPPGTTFADRLVLTVGGLTVELLHVGPAHTTNDVVVWLPEQRVLFAGDVVLAGCTPFALMGSVSGSLTAIERLAGLGAETVVCGHGPVSGPGVLAENAAYLSWVTELAATARAQGLAPLEAARSGVPERFAGLLDPERLVGNLHRAYAELAGAGPGAPLDVPPVFGEMIEFNGGRRPTCLA